MPKWLNISYRIFPNSIPCFSLKKNTLSLDWMLQIRLLEQIYYATLPHHLKKNVKDSKPLLQSWVFLHCENIWIQSCKLQSHHPHKHHWGDPSIFCCHRYLYKVTHKKYPVSSFPYWRQKKIFLLQSLSISATVLQETNTSKSSGRRLESHCEFPIPCLQMYSYSINSI